MFPRKIVLALVCFLGAGALSASAQTRALDPAADVAAPQLESSWHIPLPEQYVWLPPAAVSVKVEAGFFRKSFRLDAAPAAATLYVAGPDKVQIFVNGEAAGSGARDTKSRLKPLVLTLDVTRALRAGDNTIAVRAEHGERLAVKIVPRGVDEMAPAVVMTGADWKCSAREQVGWETPGFDDHAWPAVRALGGIEGAGADLLWNDDSAMYRWPGYDGISAYLAHLPVMAEQVSHESPGAGGFANQTALTKGSSSENEEFSVTLPNGKLSGPDAPSLVLDFGREINGRLEVASDSASPMTVEIQYGESLEEAMMHPYLGADQLHVLPRATIYGPKSAFRYALVRFLEGASPLRFKSIRLDDVYYPVHYRGSFESSDALLNRIWLTGAYTSHLCMQDTIWDAPKRDRAPWMGDLDVSGLVIDTVFADQFLMRKTMDQLIGDAGNPIHEDVNGIPGYSAFWVMGEADYYRHIGDASYLHSLHDPLIRLLDFLSGELDARHTFANPRKAWPFVDWAPDLNGDTQEARRATLFEFYRAFSDGAWLLRESGDSAAAGKYQGVADAMRAAAQSLYLDPQTGTYGNRWQTNAMAIFSGLADASQTAAIWDRVLARPSSTIITPYYNFYVISAMAQAGHRREALDWIRKYWGGMIAEGATSFWEAYDPSWPKEDFHAHLQADNDEGYFVSLSHGWSSGPTAWLTEQILGIRPTEPGYQRVNIRPDLAGLEWARGKVPAPGGLIQADYRAASGLTANIEIPNGVQADVSMPVCNGDRNITLDGSRVSGEPSENASRVIVRLTKPGRYELRSNCAGNPVPAPQVFATHR